MDCFITPTPAWANSVINGKYRCDKCPYETNNKRHLAQHSGVFHYDEMVHVLYMECDGSLEGRNELNSMIDFLDIDCTGGQSAFQDGDLKEFGDQLVEA